MFPFQVGHDHNSSNIMVPIPFEYPAKPYGPDDVPWVHKRFFYLNSFLIDHVIFHMDFLPLHYYE